MDITNIVLLISLLISITLACILGVWIMKTNGQLQELGSKKAWLDSELTSLREELVETRNKLEHSRGLEIEQAKLSQKLVAVEEAYERTSSEKQAIESIVGELQEKLQKLFTEKAELKTKVEGAEGRLNERNQVENVLRMPSKYFLAKFLNPSKKLSKSHLKPAMRQSKNLLNLCQIR